jgi:DNA invertase Pin-like site-specific DNA recombinase
MLTVLGGLAEFERHLILARTSEGRARAQARSVRFGRKLKLTVYQQQEALARRAAGEPPVEITKLCSEPFDDIEVRSFNLILLLTHKGNSTVLIRVTQTQLSTQNTPIPEHTLITNLRSYCETQYDWRL